VFVVRQTEDFLAWLDGLRDVRAQVRIAARLRQIEAGSLGDWKPVEGAVSELRVNYGPGYRLYFTRRGKVVVILLWGGNKSSQKRDIRRAVELESLLGEDL
jgi:putative addiction module killer protein